MRHAHSFSVPYRPNRFKLIQLFLSGAAAALAMTAFSFAPVMLLGFDSMDFPGLYGSVFAANTPPDTVWWLGLISHFLMAALVFPVAYDFLIQRRLLPNIPFVKGLLWGNVLWLAIELVAKPVAGFGAFSSSMPLGAAHAMFNLLDWLLYGAVFESFTRVRIVHHLHWMERRHAV